MNDMWSITRGVFHLFFDFFSIRRSYKSNSAIMHKVT